MELEESVFMVGTCRMKEALNANTILRVRGSIDTDARSHLPIANAHTLFFNSGIRTLVDGEQGT